MAQIGAGPHENLAGGRRIVINKRRSDALSACVALQELRRARPAARQGGGRRGVASARRPGPSGVAAGRYLPAGAVLADEVGPLGHSIEAKANNCLPPIPLIRAKSTVEGQVTFNS